jgi:hypothetical protein
LTVGVFSDPRYARAINPCHPLVPIQLFEAENISLLLQEPLLVSALTCVAARYADLGQSFDPREPSRARIVEKRLTEWILKRISYVAMGSYVSVNLGVADVSRAHLRTIGTVEAMLILSEWPPRAMLLEDTSFLSPEEQGNKSNASACKHQDDVAWNLVGLVCWWPRAFANVLRRYASPKAWPSRMKARTCPRTGRAGDLSGG